MACQRECQQQTNLAASWLTCTHGGSRQKYILFCLCSSVAYQEPLFAASDDNHPLHGCQSQHCIAWCRRHARTSGTPKHICLSVSRSSMQQCTLVTRNSNSTTPASWSTGKRKLWMRSCALTRRSSPRSKLKCLFLPVYIPKQAHSQDYLHFVVVLFAVNLCKSAAEACIHTCRNAEVSNTFKVDLHALHVDEAIYEVERTIKALSPFKCKYCQAVCVCVHAALHRMRSLRGAHIFHHLQRDLTPILPRTVSPGCLLVRLPTMLSSCLFDLTHVNQCDRNFAQDVVMMISGLLLSQAPGLLRQLWARACTAPRTPNFCQQSSST